MAVTIALVTLIIYVLSFGPAFAFSNSKYFCAFFANEWSRDRVLRQVYHPLVHTAETAGAEPMLWWYAGVFGTANRNSLTRHRSVAVLAIAKDALVAGDIERARSLTRRADEFDCWYDLLDDTPDYLFSLIQQEEKEAGEAVQILNHAKAASSIRQIALKMKRSHGWNTD
jgi:hypothetical protein